MYVYGQKITMRTKKTGGPKELHFVDEPKESGEKSDMFRLLELLSTFLHLKAQDSLVW